MFGSPIFVPDYILSAGLHFICTVATSADDCLVQRIIISASKLPYIHHSCQVSLCEKEFHRIFRRKHNCRFCGRVVCGECSQIKIHDNRVCNDCFHTNEGFLHTGGDDNDRAPHSQQSPHRLSSFQSQFYDNGNHGGGNQPLKASRISVKGRLSPYPVSARGVGMAMHTITEEQSPARSTDAQNSHGQTQLMLAASQGNLTRVRYLIEDIGVDVNARDNKGRDVRDYAIISEQQSISRYLNTILGGSDVMNASSQQNAVLLHEDRPTPTPSDNKADKRMKLRMGNNNDSHTRSHSGSSKSSHTSACADYLNGENNLLHDKEIGGRKIKRSRKQSVKRKQARAKDDRKRKEEAQKRKRKYLLLLLFIIAVSVYLFIDDSNFLPSSVYQRNEITQSSQSSLPSSNIGDDGNGRSADTDTAFQTDGKGAGDAGNFMGDSVIGGFNVDASQTQPLALPLFMMLSNYFWNLPKHLLHLYYDLDGNNTGTRTSTQVQTMSELFSYIPSVSMYLSVRSTEQDSVSAIWSTCAGREPERKAEAGAEVEMGEGGVQLEGRGKDDDEDAGKVSSSDGDDKAGDNVELNEGDEHKYGLKYRDDFVHIHTEARGNVNEIVARETTTGEDGNANRHIISGEEMGRHIGNCDNIVDDELMYSESDDKIEERRINTKDASSSPETSMPSPPLPLPPSSSYFTVEYIMKTVFAIITFSLTLGFVVVYTLFEDSFLGSSSATSSSSSPSSLVFTTPEPAVTAVPFAPPLSPASMHRSLQRQTTMTNDEDAAGTLEQNHTMVTHAITKTSESKVDTHSSIIHTQGEDVRHVKEEVNSNTEADTTTKAPYVFKLSRCLEYLRKEFQEHNKNITNHQSDKNHSAGEKANDVIENAENIISQLRARWMMLETQGAFTTNNNRISMRRIKEITYTNTIKQKKSADINIGYGDDDDIPEGFASEAQLQHVVWRRYCREKMIRYKNHKRTLNNEGRSFGNQIDKGKGEGDSNKKQRSKKSTVSKPKLDPNKPPSPFPANLQIIVDDVWINTEMHVRAPLSFSTSVSSTRLIHFWDFARFVVEDIEGVNGYNIAGLQKQNIPKHFLP